MPAIIIGTAKGGISKTSYNIKWNESGKEVYVSYAGWTNIGKANSSKDAMTKAEAWLYNK